MDFTESEDEEATGTGMAMAMATTPTLTPEQGCNSPSMLPLPLGYGNGSSFAGAGEGITATFTQRQTRKMLLSTASSSTTSYISALSSISDNSHCNSPNVNINISINSDRSTSTRTGTGDDRKSSTSSSSDSGSSSSRKVEPLAKNCFFEDDYRVGCVVSKEPYFLNVDCALNKYAESNPLDKWIAEGRPTEGCRGYGRLGSASATMSTRASTGTLRRTTAELDITKLSLDDPVPAKDTNDKAKEAEAVETPSFRYVDIDNLVNDKPQDDKMEDEEDASAEAYQKRHERFENTEKKNIRSTIAYWSRVVQNNKKNEAEDARVKGYVESLKRSRRVLSETDLQKYFCGLEPSNFSKTPMQYDSDPSQIHAILVTDDLPVTIAGGNLVPCTSNAEFCLPWAPRLPPQYNSEDSDDDEINFLRRGAKKRRMN